MKSNEKEAARFANVYLAYVFDLGYDIKRRALEAKEDRSNARSTEDKAFETGRVMAYHEVIAVMQQNAEGLGIALSDIRLDDIQPDRDLV